MWKLLFSERKAQMFGFATISTFFKLVIIDAVERGLHTVTKRDDFVDFQQVLKIKMYTKFVKKEKKKCNMLFLILLKLGEV